MSFNNETVDVTEMSMFLVRRDMSLAYTIWDTMVNIHTKLQSIIIL